MTEHKNIYAALAAAQAGMGTVVKGAVNPAFKSKYADLADVVAVVVPALSAQGIALYHSMIRDEHGLMMRTTLSHGATDTHIHCDVPLIVDRNNMQGMKSATTYAKRLGVESVSGVAPTDDDDGNAAAKAAPVVDAKPVAHQLQHGEALKDAWKASVEDSLPDNATPRQKAEAYAKAIADDFKGKGLKALENAWGRHARIIEALEANHPDLHERVIDAYELRRNELTEGAAA